MKKYKKPAWVTMGYRSYQEYLDSDFWKAIRKSVLKRDDYKCRICGCAATEVHHRNYKPATMNGRSLKGLWSICRGCHQGKH